MTAPWVGTLGGLAALLYGLAAIYQPAAWIIGGALVAFVSIVELAGVRR